MGKRLAESGYAVLIVNPFYRMKKAPVVPAGASFADQATRDIVMPLAQGPQPDDARHRRQGLRRVARQPGGGRQAPQDRHDRLLHGRTDRDAHGRGRAGSHRRRRVVPRRRARDQGTRQPASARADDEGALPLRRRRERRSARSRGQGRAARRPTPRPSCRPRSRSTPAPPTAGARPTRRSTTRSRPNAPGRGCWCCSRPRWRSCLQRLSRLHLRIVEGPASVRSLCNACKCNRDRPVTNGRGWRAPAR